MNASLEKAIQEAMMELDRMTDDWKFPFQFHVWYCLWYAKKLIWHDTKWWWSRSGFGFSFTNSFYLALQLSQSEKIFEIWVIVYYKTVLDVEQRNWINLKVYYQRLSSHLLRGGGKFFLTYTAVNLNFDNDITAKNMCIRQLFRGLSDKQREFL